jgi:hypothetical protein
MSSVEAQILKGPITDIYQKFKDEFKTRKPPTPEDVFRKGLLVEKVKTIWQKDKAVDLNSFYYPSKLLVDEQRIQFDSLEDFPPKAKIVIQGTAGQGKSIFLRYLSGKELKSGKHIPIFVELMKISAKTNLFVLISNYLSDLGLNCKPENLQKFIQTKKFVIFLDAFDEIPLENIKDTMQMIDELVNQNPDLQMVITSRPNAEIQKHNCFDVYDLAPLIESDFRPLLEKFYENNKPDVHRILKYLKNESERLAQLIDTPLLLTLVCLTYNSTNKIPTSPYEFYQKLFHLLTERHDATKPGFIRKFESSLTINKLESLFEAFCFYCLTSSSKSLTYQEAVSKVKAASKISDITPSSENAFLTDCVKNTCLLVKEGFDYHFIHKSIMEYHAASYISSSPPQLKMKFYEAAKLKHFRYVEELHYLSFIDEDSYERNFKVPVYENFLNNFPLNNGELSNQSIIVQITVLIRTIGTRIMTFGAKFDSGFDNYPLVGLSSVYLSAIRDFISNNFEVQGEDKLVASDNTGINISSHPISKNVSPQELNSRFEIEIDVHQSEKFLSTLKQELLQKLESVSQELEQIKFKLAMRDENIEEFDF